MAGWNSAPAPVTMPLMKPIAVAERSGRLWPFAKAKLTIQDEPPVHQNTKGADGYLRFWELPNEGGQRDRAYNDPDLEGLASPIESV